MSNLEVRYRIVGDDSGHEYVIPVHMCHEWDVWLSSDDASDGVDPPEWAKRIEGSLTFTDPRT